MRRNEEGRIAAIRAAFASKKRVESKPRSRTQPVVMLPPPPTNRATISCELRATPEQIAALGPERARAFMTGVAQLFVAATAMPNKPNGEQASAANPTPLKNSDLRAGAPSKEGSQ